MMKVTRKTVSKANEITNKYSGYRNPEEIIKMYEELEAIGITTGCITNRRDNGAGAWEGTCEWYFEGEEVENSLFVFGVYEGNPNTIKNDYNVYFS